ncbi:MAG: arginine--tRNA ligase, partial [Paludibacter sp.]|nr:arginine--tRNA ligase [Paludibacter sp.]
MNIETALQSLVKAAVAKLYAYEASDAQIQIQKTKKEFEGDLTVVIFPFVKAAKKSPEAAGEEIGNYLLEQHAMVSAFNVIKGFLNLTIDTAYWIGVLNTLSAEENFGQNKVGSGKLMMVEYSSPNTNKPLHLGHIRNNLLGFSIAEIQKANGWEVVKTNIVNDRGIHICKSMLAWKLFGNGETPETSGMKGDHLVGKYYVEFDKALKAEVKTLMEQGLTEEDAKRNAPLMRKAQEMLLAWENHDPEVYTLWETMNGWVYEGFDATYRRMGVDFDKIYYESQTYLEGKSKVEEGLGKGV